ncbi:MAG TPA: acyltransferase [Bryobacteraceae bacterium]
MTITLLAACAGYAVAVGNSFSATRENRALNVIRTASALLVVLGHVRILLFEDYAEAPHNAASALLYSFTSLGSEAVIVFFVLSGYWVGGGVIGKLRSRAFAWSSYASGRLTRLWLDLLPALVLTFVVDQVGRSLFQAADIYANTTQYAGVPDAPSYSWSTLLGNVFFVQSIHVSEYGLNKPLWSLAYEFWYYAIFPGLLTAFWKGGRTRDRVVGGIVFLFGVAVAGPEVLMLFPAWLVGAGVAAWRQPIGRALSRLERRTLSGLRFGALIAMLGAMVVAHQVSLPSRLGAWIVAVAAGCLVSLFAVDLDWVGSRGRALTAVSSTANFSYSIYAIHMPVVALVAAILVPDFRQRWPLDGLHGLIGLLIVGMLATLSWLFAKATEQRTDAVRAWITVRFRSRGRVAP